ncbi:MAG: hypothetical protein JWO75_3929, partial [Actinomycetia bacterium]|nr:hypothetical protein [Actinomycetes bacterium]
QNVPHNYAKCVDGQDQRAERRFMIAAGGHVR